MLGFDFIGGVAFLHQSHATLKPKHGFRIAIPPGFHEPAGTMPARKSAKKTVRPISVPPASDWRTTDQDEILRRVQRARDEKHSIANLHPEHPVFSTFAVKSPSGMTYQVEIRDLKERAFSCTCPDFRTAGLGTCKHVEATLIWLKRRFKGEVRLAETHGSPRIDIIPNGDTLQVERNTAKLPKSLRPLFDTVGNLLADPEEAVEKLRRHPKVRVSQDVDHFLESRHRSAERRALRRDYETGVVEGRHPEHVTLHPLYPYQREGMLHLAFGERALLADEMGLGKTIQAVAACALLHHLGKARRVLVVTPASLKTEWEEQIRKFTTHPQQIVFGPRSVRLKYYSDHNPPLFTIVNYEQVVTDSLDINTHLRPDIVVLDEAQRIKNWATKTAQAVKRLQSRYAFVLTGTPIENRIDELYSIVDFLDPALLGPLFRFNREFYQFDEKGRPSDYQNLPVLRERVKPVLLRRRKHHVETELPDRTDRNHFVKLTPAMQAEYDDVKQSVADLVQKSLRRPLTKKEQDLLMILLGMMRMICDSPSIIKNRDCKDCPKLDELARVLDEALSDPDVKVIVFSEWEGMLKKVRAWADRNGVGYAWHTGSVPQQKRRGEILAFRNDPDCRLFLSTDSGGVGLNLQNASVVVNCDLPWNPAKLEQRIARAWRKHQTRPVTVINLIAENTIEHSMLETLANKMSLAEGVLDGTEESLANAKLKRGREANLARLQQFLSISPTGKPADRKPTPADPTLAFAERADAALGRSLVHCQEAMLPGEATPVLLTVLRDPTRGAAVAKLFQDTDWRGDPPRLHVLDESTWHAIQQLAAAGLLTLNTRATRHLTGDAPPPPPKPVLTPEQLQRIADLKAFAAKKQKVARLLIDSDLAEEAEPHQKAADKALEEAEWIENGHLPDAGSAG
jgi:superfamily II DNA or RNA helicase